MLHSQCLDVNKKKKEKKPILPEIRLRCHPTMLRCNKPSQRPFFENRHQCATWKQKQPLYPKLWAMAPHYGCCDLAALSPFKFNPPHSKSYFNPPFLWLTVELHQQISSIILLNPSHATLNIQDSMHHSRSLIKSHIFHQYFWHISIIFTYPNLKYTIISWKFSTKYHATLVSTSNSFDQSKFVSKTKK